MKKTKLALLALTGISFLWSCKKDNSSTDTGSSSYPKTYTEDIRSSVIGNSVTIYDLTYDGNNRLTGLTATPAPPLLNFVYAYPSANTVSMDLFDHGNLSIHENFWLNGSSKVDSTFQFDDSGDTTTEKYTYDASHLLVQQKEYDYSHSGSTLSNTTNYTYDNQGNATQSVDDQGTTTYTYYTDLPYTLNVGQPFIPVPSYFIKTLTLTSGGTTETGTHYYTFDSSKRLLKDSATTTGSDLIVIKSYTY